MHCTCRVRRSSKSPSRKTGIIHSLIGGLAQHVQHVTTSLRPDKAPVAMVNSAFPSPAQPANDAGSVFWLVNRQMPVNGAVTRNRCFLASGSFKTELNAKGNDLFDRSKANFMSFTCGVWWVFFVLFFVFLIFCVLSQLFAHFLLVSLEKNQHNSIFTPLPIHMNALVTSFCF